MIAIGFLFAFFWAVGDGQYDDDFTPSLRILVDDDMIPPTQDNSQNNNFNESKPVQNVED
jgi:cbb3-type cytochrome oxidase maturation protein